MQSLTIQPNDSRRRDLALLAALALLPFIAKAIVLLLGVRGYGPQSIYKVFQLIGPCCWRYWYVKARGGRILWPTDDPLPTGGTWAIGVAVAVGLSGVAIAAANWILPRMHMNPMELRTEFDKRFTLGPAGALLVVMFLSLVNSGLEELHFRAWLDRELSVRLNSWAGMSISAGAFGAMHVLIFLGMPGLPTAAVVLVPCALAIAGVSWSMIMRRSGGIHAAWLSHGLTDALLLGWGLHWLGYV